MSLVCLCRTCGVIKINLTSEREGTDENERD